MPPQHRETLVKTGLDRAQRTSLHVGDLLKGHAVVLLQDDRGSLLLGKQRHRFFDDRTQLTATDKLLDRLCRTAFGRELTRVNALRHLHDRRPSLPTDPVTTEVQ